MQRRIMILEDDKVSMTSIRLIIEDLHRDVEIFCADSLKEAYSIVMEQQMHLLIVDIVLKPENPGDVSGFRFVQEIRKVKKYEFVPVIFVTSLENPKLYSYTELNCLGYIEKPYDEAQIKRYVLKALDFPVVEDQERCVYFRKEGIAYCKRISEIYYIEISRRKLLVHCENENLEIPYKTCAEILKELDSPAFVQCSRYAIVNKQYIEYIDYARRYIKLKNQKQLIEIGPIMKNKFKVEIENGTGFS